MPSRWSRWTTAPRRPDAACRGSSPGPGSSAPAPARPARRARSRGAWGRGSGRPRRWRRAGSCSGACSAWTLPALRVSSFCASPGVPSVATVSTCVSPRVKRPLPCTRGRMPTSTLIGPDLRRSCGRRAGSCRRGCARARPSSRRSRTPCASAFGSCCLAQRGHQLGFRSAFIAAHCSAS